MYSWGSSLEREVPLSVLIQHMQRYAQKVPFLRMPTYNIILEYTCLYIDFFTEELIIQIGNTIIKLEAVIDLCSRAN